MLLRRLSSGIEARLGLEADRLANQRWLRVPST